LLESVAGAAVITDVADRSVTARLGRHRIAGDIRDVVRRSVSSDARIDRLRIGVAGLGVGCLRLVWRVCVAELWVLPTGIDRQIAVAASESERDE
jgi:hypothetical protein